MAAIHSGTRVVPFGATMCCSNLSFLFSADGRGTYLPLFGNTSLVAMFVLCLCAGQSNNTADLRALDLGFARSKAFTSAYVVPLTSNGLSI